MRAPRYELMQQRKILFIAVWSKVEIGRNALQLFRLYGLFIFFHELLIHAPGNSRSLHGGLLRTNGNLVRMHIVEPQLVDQGLLDDLVRQEEGCNVYALRPRAKRARQVAIDVDRASILAVARDMGMS